MATYYCAECGNETEDDFCQLCSLPTEQIELNDNDLIDEQLGYSITSSRRNEF